MPPKYRGDSEDWLDHTGQKNASPSKKKSHKSKDTAQTAEQANATVVEVFQNQCRVKMDPPDSSSLLCNYRRASVFQADKVHDMRERTPVTVGDRVVAVKAGPQDGVVEAFCTRKNFLARPAPGNESGAVLHVVAANIDLLMIVASTVQPDFSPGLVDRYLIAAQAAKIDAHLCVTKSDLLSQSQPWKIYVDLGFQVFEVNSKKGEGIERLKSTILGKTVAFCGHSGVGKTSLLRALMGNQTGQIGNVNQVTGKGTHTTTGSVLLEGPENSHWIDTPGIRAFGLQSVSAENLSQYFPEWNDAQCAIASCQHLDEEGCSVKNTPRYSSYRRILESILAGEQ